ncbi:MAG TPA: HAD-IC family P-type ATPase, partial [Geobacterales bacterium]|nr:HAD-IC family P-type ATPase [Geobacterales bacterium]
MAATLTRHWHHGAEEEILSLLGSSGEQGLDPLEVHRRQQRFGPNQVTAKRGDSPLLLFLQQFHQPLIYILLASATVTTLLREWVDASVILGVVLVNAIFGFLQELKAVQAIESLSRILTTQTEVLRGGERLQIPSTELVSGDIVLLHSGDRVPADIRLLQARDLHLDESALTGESLPVHKSPGVLPGETPLSDRTNMLYSMTLVTYGTATGVVVTIGDQTEIGRINELIAAVDPLETPLTRKISRFSRQLLYAILALALFTIVVGMLRGEGWIDMFMAAVALAVGAIPEGLPAALTITLAIGVSKMARRNAIIRKLPAVETLGGTTVICSDKTGTLTQNQMTVQQIAVAGNLFHLSGVGYLPHGLFRLQGEAVSPEDHPALRECLLAGLLCNESRVVSRGDDWFVEGDPTEGALVVAAIKGGLDREKLAAQFPRRDAIPFESQYQYMATLHDRPDGSGVLYLKGSVE